jgi:PAS domain S-box-containing protein
MDVPRKYERWRRNMTDSMVLTGIFLAAAYWGLEALINLFSPDEISFYREIFGPNVSGMGMRIVVLCLFLIFGSHVQYTINNRKQAEQALKESEEKYRTILESIEEGYYEVDLEGHFTFANDATSRIFGLSKMELHGMSFSQFMAPEHGRKAIETLRECLRTGGSVKAFDCELRHGDAVLQIEASVYLLKNPADEVVGFRGMLRDRTEKKKLEMDLLESYRKLQNARAATILGLAKLAEYRDEGTGTHLERIREYARLLADEMARLEPWRDQIDQGFVDDLYQSAILHDIGKVGVPDAVLLKPGELTEEEFEVIKCHTLFGGDAISAIETQIEGRSFLNIGKEIAYNHHEKWDGTGYPHGLQGLAIPLAARIVALADVYDALTTKRFYKEAYSHQKARQIILNLRGTHFDPEVVEVFLRLEGQFDRIREEKLRQENQAVISEGACRRPGEIEPEEVYSADAGLQPALPQPPCSNQPAGLLDP